MSPDSTIYLSHPIGWNGLQPLAGISVALAKLVGLRSFIVNVGVDVDVGVFCGDSIIEDNSLLARTLPVNFSSSTTCQEDEPEMDEANLLLKSR